MIIKTHLKIEFQFEKKINFTTEVLYPTEYVKLHRYV